MDPSPEKATSQATALHQQISKLQEHVDSLDAKTLNETAVKVTPLLDLLSNIDVYSFFGG